MSIEVVAVQSYWIQHADLAVERGRHNPVNIFHVTDLCHMITVRCHSHHSGGFLPEWIFKARQRLPLTFMRQEGFVLLVHQNFSVGVSNHDEVFCGRELAAAQHVLTIEA